MTTPTTTSGTSNVATPASTRPKPAIPAPRPLPAFKPPQPRVAATAPAPAAPKPAAPAAGSVKPVQRVIKASELTAEDVFKRLYFLESVYRHQKAYIKDLQSRLSRTGTAVPTMPHIDPLKSAAGDIDPNVI